MALDTSALSVKGNFKLVEISIVNPSDVFVKVLMQHFQEELNDIEDELTRINGISFEVKYISDVYPGLCCVAFEPKQRKYVRCEVLEMFLDSDRTINCMALDYGSKFSTSANEIRPLPKSLGNVALPFRCRTFYLSTIRQKKSLSVDEKRVIQGDLKSLRESFDECGYLEVLGFKGFDACGDIISKNHEKLSQFLLGKFSAVFEPKVFNSFLDFDHVTVNSVSALNFKKQEVSPQVFVSRLDDFKNGLMVPDMKEEVKKTTSDDPANWSNYFDMINLNDLEEISPPKSLSLNNSITETITETTPDRTSVANLSSHGAGCHGQMVDGTSSEDSSASNTESLKILRVKQRFQAIKQKRLEKTQSTADMKVESIFLKESGEDISEPLGSVTKHSPYVLEEPSAYRYSKECLGMKNLKGETSDFEQLSEEGHKLQLFEDVFIVGLSRKPWITPEEFLNNLDWITQPDLVNVLSGYTFPLIANLCCDVLAVEASDLDRRKHCVNLALWVQASRLVKCFDKENENRRGINLKGPGILIILPNYLDIQMYMEVFEKRLMAFKSWRPIINADYGWGVSSNCQILLTTPVRLLENLNNNSTNFNRVKFILVDSADVVFDKFYRDIAECMKKFKRAEAQRIVKDWRLLIFSKSYHPKFTSFLKIRQWKGKDFAKHFSLVFTDLFLGCAFLGVIHIPLVTERVNKNQLVFEVLNRNCVENSNVIIFCSQDRTCISLSAKLYDNGYNVVCVLDGEVRKKMQNDDEVSSSAEFLSLKASVTVVLTSDNNLDQVADTGLAFYLMISYEEPNPEAHCQRRKLGDRCSLSKCALEISHASAPKFFHIFSDETSLQYVALMRDLFKCTRVLKSLSCEVEDNFEMYIDNLVAKEEEQKVLNGVSLCEEMLLHPTYLTKSRKLISCGNVLCGKRHQITEKDRPGSDQRFQELPNHGYVRLRVTTVRGANSFYANLEDYRETQAEPYEPKCREVLREIEDAIDDVSDFVAAVVPKKVQCGKLYLLNRNRVFLRVVVVSFNRTDKHGVPTSVNLFRVETGELIEGVLVSQLYDVPAGEPDLKKFPGQAFRVVILGITSLDGSTKFAPQIIKFVEEKILLKLVEAMVVLSLSNTMFVHLFTLREKMADGTWAKAGYRIKNDLIERKLCLKNDDHMFLIHESAKKVFGDMPVLKKLLAASDIKYHEIDCLEKETFNPVVLIAGHSKKATNEFFVIKKDTAELVERLQEDIARKANTFTPVNQTDAGKYLVANIKRKDASTLWCRVKVVKVNVVKKEAKVFLIDAGKVTLVKFSKLRNCPNDIFLLPSAAIGCSLVNISPVEPALGFKCQFRESLLELSDSSSFEVVAYAPNLSGNNASPQLTPIEIYFKEAAASPRGQRSNANFSILSKQLCSRGLAIGSSEFMKDLFKSSFKSAFLKFHSSYWLDEKEPLDVLETLVELSNVADAELVWDDLVFLVCSYQSVIVLEALFTALVKVARKCKPVEIFLNQITFKCLNVHRNLSPLCIQLIKDIFLMSCKEDSDELVSAIVYQLEAHQMSLDMSKALINFLSVVDTSSFTSDLIQMCIVRFTPLLRNFSIQDLTGLCNLLWKITQQHFQAFVDSLTLCSNFVQLLVKQYPSELPSDVKMCLVQIVLKLFTVHRYKFVIGSSNALLANLRRDLSEGSMFLKVFAKKLVAEIERYRLEQKETKPICHQGRAHGDVQDLNVNWDASGYVRLNPKVIWWQSQSFLSISFEVFGIRAKRICYEDRKLLFEALTLDDRFYCVCLEFYSEIDKGSVLESFSGREVQIRINKRECGLWDRLTTNRVANLVFNSDHVDRTEDDDSSCLWEKKRAATLIKNCAPDEGYPRCSDDDNSSLNSEDESPGNLSDLLASADEL